MPIAVRAWHTGEVHTRPCRPTLLASGALLVTLVACSSPTPQQELVLEAVATIARGDQEAYSELTITLADLELRRQGIGGLTASQTFLGGTIRPSQREEQVADFHRAVAAGGELIDLRTAEVEAVELLGNVSLEGLDGATFDAELYGLRVAGVSTPPERTFPQVAVVPWGSFFRVLALRLE